MPQPSGVDRRNVVASRVGQAWQELVMAYGVAEGSGSDYAPENHAAVMSSLDAARDAAMAAMAAATASNNP